MKIGIIGGGQLGMMMADEAIKLGHSIISLDPNPNCSLARFSEKHIEADYDDYDSIKELYQLCDVITYEFENVNYNLVREFEDKIPQKHKALFITQNRLREKEFVKNLTIPTPSFFAFSDNEYPGFPVIVKTCTGGYDGKGQQKAYNKFEFDQLITDKTLEYIIEEKIDFDYEISVILTRDCFGHIYAQPITKNDHKNGILFTSKTHCNHDEEITQKAVQYATQIIKELDYIGTLAVEFFVKSKNVIFNEYAPRPHNSGHFSIEGVDYSQYKNHILAITGSKIYQPSLIKHCTMINILGQDMAYIDVAKQFDECHIHLYFKKDAKLNRKMGHITICSENISKLSEIEEAFLKE
jgi:5-(carboxyamino)imidazole ribonucleotide synthase